MPELRGAFREIDGRIRYVDPVNRARDSYLRGDIDIAEFELRVNDLLGLERRWLRDAKVMHDPRETA